MVVLLAVFALSTPKTKAAELLGLLVASQIGRWILLFSLKLFDERQAKVSAIRLKPVLLRVSGEVGREAA